MMIGNQIRKLRLQKHLSQEMLGERLGVTGQAVSKWEQGVTSPDISLLPELSVCFGVTIDSLFTGTADGKFPGYGNERNELYAIYTSEGGTEADFCRAEEAYREVILSGNASAEDYVSYGLLHSVRASRDQKTALYYFRRAILEGNEKRDIHWMSAHQMVTKLLESMGQLQKAVEEHRRWCEAEPECAWAHVSYAYALERAGNLKQACAEIEKALELDPEDVNVCTMAGDLFGKAGSHDEAVFYWDKAFALDGTCISCLFSKAELFASTGHPEKAVRQYEEILVWLNAHGYNMALERAHPLRRIEELRAQIV